MIKKVEELLNEKKETLKEFITNIKSITTAKRIATGIGAAAIVATSAMGLTSCDKPLFGGDESSQVETMPTYSYEEYESAFKEIFKEELEKQAEGDYYLQGLSVRYAIYNDQETSRGTFNFEDANNNSLNINIDELNLSKEAYINLRDGLPENALSVFAKGWGFTADLSKLNEEDKVKLCKLFFDQYSKLNPDKIEDLTLGK